MTNKIFRLPDEEEFLRRLDDFNPSAAKLHRIMSTRMAGREIMAPGFVLEYTLAVADYTQGLPMSVVAVAEIATHQYAKHLIDDDEGLAETLEVIGEMGLPND